MKAKHMSIFIRLNAKKAYERLWRPESFPKWASGLAGSLKKTRDGWIARTPEGLAKVRFSKRNALGVLDHWVYLPGGSEVYVPLRIIANGDGCELILTLFRQSGMSDRKFAADAKWVMRDLKTARKLLQRR